MRSSQTARLRSKPSSLRKSRERPFPTRRKIAFLGDFSLPNSLFFGRIGCCCCWMRIMLFSPSFLVVFLGNLGRILGWKLLDVSGMVFFCFLFFWGGNWWFLGSILANYEGDFLWFLSIFWFFLSWKLFHLLEGNILMLFLCFFQVILMNLCLKSGVIELLLIADVRGRSWVVEFG